VLRALQLEIFFFEGADKYPTHFSLNKKKNVYKLEKKMKEKVKKK
jgi:transcription initiation factor IIF auxiliary subunit